MIYLALIIGLIQIIAAFIMIAGLSWFVANFSLLLLFIFFETDKIIPWVYILSFLITLYFLRNIFDQPLSLIGQTFLKIYEEVKQIRVSNFYLILAVSGIFLTILYKLGFHKEALILSLVSLVIWLLYLFIIWSQDKSKN
ncbi:MULTISPECIES: hypothetical protein [unclassified Moorena]|uniref:hypothetical protein n=1 Tax=unclassified Moorena TaxID=2683338 RepID=UPI0013B81F82|nr:MULTISPECIES: hypothetical protein [unclassified Moorena]NEP32677.1 hypothetical protein [Moorena sp. SIO3B2]NEQ14802.1 hypothetical protein [Moorena sp. SIO3E2]NER92202.1 hypothetical protein [Moorena sp. SIO3A2]NES42068.1 hypothetical protein [Moorena sp. SIO2C4]